MKILLVTDDHYLPVILQSLDHARSSVDLLAFSFATGRMSQAPEQIARKLVEIKKKRDLPIRVYLEGERETQERNRVTGAFLKRSGISVKYGATHAKGFAIDGKYVLFGSTNLTNQSITKNNETNLFIEDARISAEFDRYFVHLWNGGKQGGIRLRPPLIADGGFKAALIKMIDAAKSRLEFSIYFFRQTEIEAALIRAHQRGIKITGFVHRHFRFAMDDVRKTRKTVERLRASGVTDLHFGPGNLFTHSKYLIRDRAELLLGTGNWIDEDVTTHPQLYIRVEEAKIAGELARHLRQQIKIQSEV